MYIRSIFFHITNSMFKIHLKFTHVVNVIKLKFNGVKCGKKIKSMGVMILKLHPKSKVVIGDNTNLISNRRRCSASSLYSPIKLSTFGPTSEIVIGNNVGLNGTVIISRSQKIEIGDNTIVAGNVVIVDSDFHNPWPPEQRMIFDGMQTDQSIYIGKNCWLGMNSIILKGVHIGNNSIIGAGSIVVKNIPENCLAAGAPAKVIKIYKKKKSSGKGKKIDV